MVSFTINKKRGLLIAIVVALSMVLVAPLTALATHKNSEQYGEISSTYGHFGQPHGYVISGDFTFIVEATGPVNRVTFKITKASDRTTALQTYGHTAVTASGDKTKFFSLLWNSTGFADGDYLLFADVHDDSTPGGWQDFAVHYNGANSLAFTVKNPVIPTPPPSDPPEDTCSDNLNNAKKYAKQIYDKHNSSLGYIDQFLQLTTLFYKKNESTVKNHDSELAQISEVRKAASDSIVTLEQLKNFSCETNLKDQVDSYLAKSEETRNQLDDYKDSVINLMVKVLEELNV